MASQRSLKLGSFVQDESGSLHGTISGLGVGTVRVVTQEALSQDGRRYLKLIADPLLSAYEVGAAFPKEKEGMSYYSVQIDSPVLSAPINAALFPDKENEIAFNLVWNRPEVAKLAAEATANAGQTAQTQGPRYKGVAP
jgi:uncharacterized protein (DUF736 family)